jgi:hypothetical protein
VKRLALLLSAGLILGVGSAGALRLPSAPKCPIFPRSNVWNKRVDRLPVAADSARIIRSIGLDTGLHPDFGSGKYGGGPIGIPFNVVSKRTKRVHLSFDYADESDKGPYPLPRHVKAEYGSDHHALMIDRSRCKLYEVFACTDTMRARARSGTCARTTSAPRDGPRQTPRGCRSSRVSSAGTR